MLSSISCYKEAREIALSTLERSARGATARPPHSGRLENHRYPS
jgi:hypothetical protein